MSIQQRESIVKIMCNDCNAILEVAANTAIKSAIKSEGWTTEYKSGKWRHYCADCQEALSAPVGHLSQGERQDGDG